MTNLNDKIKEIIEKIYYKGVKDCDIDKEHLPLTEKEIRPYVKEIEALMEEEKIRFIKIIDEWFIDNSGYFTSCDDLDAPKTIINFILKRLNNN